MLMVLALGLGLFKHWCRKGTADAEDAGSLALVSEADLLTSICVGSRRLILMMLALGDGTLVSEGDGCC